MERAAGPARAGKVRAGSRPAIPFDGAERTYCQLPAQALQWA
jgi:hypothetical protein